MAKATNLRSYHNTIFASPKQLRELADLIESGTGIAFSEDLLVKEHGSHHVEKKLVSFVNPLIYTKDSNSWRVCDYTLNKIGIHHFLYDLGMGSNRIQNSIKRIKIHYKILYPKLENSIVIFLRDIEKKWQVLVMNIDQTFSKTIQLEVETESELDLIEYFNNKLLYKIV